MSVGVERLEVHLVTIAEDDLERRSVRCRGEVRRGEEIRGRDGTPQALIAVMIEQHDGIWSDVRLTIEQRDQ